MKLRHLLAGASAMVLAGQAMASEIRGTVNGPDGKPLAGAQVVIEDLQRGKVTAADGRFVIESVPSGPVHVTVTAPKMSAVFETVEVPGTGAATLAVTLKPNTLLRRSAELSGEPKPEHLAQKAAYLASIGKVRGKTPNIVILLFDDLGFGDFSSFGNRLAKTPNIDSFAGEGVRLNQFYSPSGVCSPSRAAMLTGRYPTRAHAGNHVFMETGSEAADLRRSRGLANGLPADEVLLPEVLQRAGYSTGLFGKWHLGDQPGHLPTDFGFQQFFGVHYANNMKPLHIWRGTTINTPAEKVDQATLTERITDEALTFLSANKDKPFFAFVSYTAPHQPHHANPKHKGVSEGGTYGDVLEDLDTNVGRIQKALRDLKLDDDTVVIVTSDNGADFLGSSGELRGRKGDTFEGGTRVPGFVVWPGHIAPNTVSDQMSMNIDLFPTILSALGIPLPADRLIDGKDIAPLLSGGETPHDYLYFLTSWGGQYEAVRDEQFKYRDPVADDRLITRQRGSGGRAALYNLALDNETHDVSARHPDEQARLQEALRRFRDDTAKNVRGWK